MVVCCVALKRSVTFRFGVFGVLVMFFATEIIMTSMLLLIGFLATALRAQSCTDESAWVNVAGIDIDAEAERELEQLWQEVLKYDDHDDGLSLHIAAINAI